MHQLRSSWPQSDPPRRPVPALTAACYLIQPGPTLAHSQPMKFLDLHYASGMCGGVYIFETNHRTSRVLNVSTYEELLQASLESVFTQTLFGATNLACR